MREETKDIIIETAFSSYQIFFMLVFISIGISIGLNPISYIAASATLLTVNIGRGVRKANRS